MAETLTKQPVPKTEQNPSAAEAGSEVVRNSLTPETVPAQPAQLTNTNKEPFLETPEEVVEEVRDEVDDIYEEFEQEHPKELESLDVQYDLQKELLERSGLVGRLSTGETGIIGVDGSEYPVPTFDEVEKAVEANKAVIEAKKKQGFTRLLLVPFGMPLRTMADKYTQELKKTQEKYGSLLNPLDKTEEIQLDADKPLKTDSEDYKGRITKDSWLDGDMNRPRSGQMIYEPEKVGFFKSVLMRIATNPFIGPTKQEYIQQHGGWRVLMVEDTLQSPKLGEKIYTTGGRHPLTSGWNMVDQLATIKKNPQYYKDEAGFTLEDWLTLAITNLEGRGTVTDAHKSNPDYPANENRFDYGNGVATVGSYFHRRGGSGITFSASFEVGSNQASIIGQYHNTYSTPPGAFNGMPNLVNTSGIRTAVKIL